jgi:hypothetical protein
LKDRGSTRGDKRLSRRAFRCFFHNSFVFADSSGGNQIHVENQSLESGFSGFWFVFSNGCKGGVKDCILRPSLLEKHAADFTNNIKSKVEAKQLFMLATKPSPAASQHFRTGSPKFSTQISGDCTPALGYCFW